MSAPSISGSGLAVKSLEELAGELGGRGYATTLVTGSGYPALTVVHRKFSRLAETIYAAPADGSWWLWWSWAERIAPVGETSAAASKIEHVLTAS